MTDDLQPSVVPPRTGLRVWKVIAIAACAFLALLVVMAVVAGLGVEGY